MRDLIRDICAQHEVDIMKGHVAKDHVHLFVTIPPQVTISRLLQWVEREDGPSFEAPSFRTSRSSSGDDTCGREDTSVAVREM